MLNLANFRQYASVRATGMSFASSGLIFGTWAALIPWLKYQYGLDEAQLGLLLLAPPVGIVFANPVSITLLNRYGAVRTTLGALLAGVFMLFISIASPTLFLTVPFLFLLGCCMAILNVAMNTCAAMLEQEKNIRILSTCHGLWSSGAMAGSAIASSALGLGIAAPAYIGGLAGFIILMVFQLKRPLSLVPEKTVPSYPAESEAPKGFSWPNSALWLLIVLSLCTNLTEGTISDWGAVFMREETGVGEAVAGWGFAVYAFFMAGGRFLGDEIIARFGGRAVLRAGGIIACTGLMPAVFFQHPALVLAGFALVGAGVSLGAPILYAAASRVPGMAKGAGLATMNTFAMAAFLGGPALIGFIAKAFSLPFAFGVVAALTGIWIWKAVKV